MNNSKNKNKWCKPTRGEFILNRLKLIPGKISVHISIKICTRKSNTRMSMIWTSYLTMPMISTILVSMLRMTILILVIKSKWTLKINPIKISSKPGLMMRILISLIIKASMLKTMRVKNTNVRRLGLISNLKIYANGFTKS